MDKSKVNRDTSLSSHTFCRHGFHDWIVVPEGPDEQKTRDAKRVIKCKHCGKYRYIQTL